jgi:hypothetical protein
MKRGVALGVAFICVLLMIGVVWALTHYAGLQASLLWTAIIGAAAWAVRSNLEQKREYQKLLAARKQEHYFQFLEFLSKFVGFNQSSGGVSSGDGRPPVSTDEFRMWSLRLTLIGSDDVVLEWNNARKHYDTVEPVASLKNWGKFVASNASRLWPFRYQAGGYRCAGFVRQRHRAA